MKFTSSLKLKLIYVFRINDEAHKNCLKIGETTSNNPDIEELRPNSKALNKAARKRIDQYTSTAGISYELLHTELSVYSNSGYQSFSDHEVHKVLKRSGIQKKLFDKKNKANEWFVTDLDTVKKAILAVKEGRNSLDTSEITEGRSPIIFRPEQRRAIDKTKKQFHSGNEMLWFAKMRFGKTLSALQVIKEHDFRRTLILTHRPVVDKGWFEDFGKIFYDDDNYSYGSKNQGEQFLILESNCENMNKNYVYFASIQDLRGAKLVGGNFDKNNELFTASWDFLIIDEAHEGTQTDLGKNVVAKLKKNHTKLLHLSGTPFNLLENYQEEEIFTWDYVMEQRAKYNWDKTHFGDPNPYSSLPKLNIYTYDLGKLLNSYVDEEVAFNFREFFRVNNDGDFLHEKDVLSFLNLICKEDESNNYPFSTDQNRENFRHSLWMLPGVKEARALSSMLKSHPVFGHFEIVNVAGDGDEEESNEKALEKVENAISNQPDKTFTITLSCGRLTTGVSVKAWTAVIMLSGSRNSSASSYMQTIFRVQTPAIINGRVKEECYVFDFAPDRTLKVIAEAAKVSAKAGDTSDSDRAVMAEFLNFCPIISFDGSQMKDYDVNGMLEQLKKVHVERVVNNGFEDSKLYNLNQLLQLTGLEIDEFNGLRKVIGSTKKLPRLNEIEINNQGFTEEDFEKTQQAKKKKKKELTEEEKELLEQLKERKKIRETAISILRGISIRMPLLIYGADIADDHELTLDSFIDMVDDQSWNEFMPKGVDKSTFETFKKYYDQDVFRAAGRRIRELTRSADNSSIEERIDRITAIFSKFRNPDKETVLTPWRVVNMHIADTLGGYTFLDERRDKTVAHPKLIKQGKVTELVFAPSTRILEINSKSGLYPLYMSYSIFRNRLEDKYPNKQAIDITIEEQQKIWDKTISENIFVLCKTPMAKSITKRTLLGFRNSKINTHHFEDMSYQITKRQKKFISKIRKGQSYWNTDNSDNMKFNAIVGNPPYQEMDGGAQSSAKPIYHEFVNVAKKIKPDYISMIMPSRWTTGGKGLDSFREEMLNDKHVGVLVDYFNASDCFPGVEIKGGVCYFLWNRNKTGKCKITAIDSQGKISMSERFLLEENNDIYIRYNGAVEILNKILGFNELSFSTIVSARKPFGLETSYKITDDVQGSPATIKIFGNKKTGYISADKIDKNTQWIDKFKLFVPYAIGSGDSKSDVIKPIKGLPPSICTETYLVYGPFERKEQMLNTLSYVQTKFFHFLLTLRKNTQHATSGTYKYIPIQDFNETWNDKKLYSKYNLNREEIELIEGMVSEKISNHELSKG